MADSDCCGHRPVYGDGRVRSTIALRWIIVRCPFVGLLLLPARLLGIVGLQALINVVSAPRLDHLRGLCQQHSPALDA
jgi:hypothetical protein